MRHIAGQKQEVESEQYRCVNWSLADPGPAIILMRKGQDTIMAAAIPSVATLTANKYVL